MRLSEGLGMMPKNKKIMFVCTGNTCRSPMAEAIFNHLAMEKGLEVRAESMGIATATGTPISENSVIVCNEIGIDISNMRSNSYEDKLKWFDEYDKFYCMSTGHKYFLMVQENVPSDRIEVMNISDPYMCGIDVYRHCRDEIYSAVEEILKQYEN